MSMNAVQEYAKMITSTVQGRLYTKPTNVVITPPNPGNSATPQAYVWVTDGDAARQTAPRGLGFINVNWIVSIWLMYTGSSTANNADRAFVNLCDETRKLWLATPMPVPITDADTGEVSQITSVGEEWTIQQSPVRAVADQRYVTWEALFRFTIKEKTQS